jgi:hypothetical protein
MASLRSTLPLALRLAARRLVLPAAAPVAARFLSADTAPVTAAFWSKLSAASANKVAPRIICSGQGAYLTIGSRDYLNFCSSHYLGFAEEPRLKKAAQEAIDKFGLGTGYRTLGKHNT